MKILPLILVLCFFGLSFSLEHLASYLKDIATEIHKLRETIEEKKNDRIG